LKHGHHRHGKSRNVAFHPQPTFGAHLKNYAATVTQDLALVVRGRAKSISHEGHPAHVDALYPHANGLRPSSDVIEATPPIAGYCQGILRRYSQVDACDVMGPERECGCAGHHGPAYAFSASAGSYDNSRQAAGEIRPDHADLDMSHNFVRSCERGEYCSDIRLRSAVQVSLKLVFVERMSKKCGAPLAERLRGRDPRDQAPEISLVKGA
jgi:hypothetical protein